MEIQTALGASSSSSMQLNEHINSINTKTEKLTISDDSCAIGGEEYVKFISKAKEQINCFTQLLRGIMDGYLEQESISQLDIDIINIHWDRSADEAYYANPDIIVLDIYDKASIEVPIAESIDDEVGDTIQLVFRQSFKVYLKGQALKRELIKWLDFDMDINSDSDDEAISDLDML